jgi:hypothetical protein
MLKPSAQPHGKWGKQGAEGNGPLMIKVVQVIIKDSSSSSKGLVLLTTAFTAAFLSLIEDLCNGAGRHKVSILCVLLAI